MKIKVLGILFLLSILVCGGGVDSNSMIQAIVGAVLISCFGGALVYESNKKEISQISSCNVHNRPCYLPR